MLDVWLGSEYAFGLPLDFYPGISEIMRTSIFRIISNGLVLVALHFFGIQNISICSAYHYIMELMPKPKKHYQRSNWQPFYQNIKHVLRFGT